MLKTTLIGSTLALGLLLAAHALAGDGSGSGFTTGNGVKNMIMAEGVAQSGSTFTFSEVVIDGNGWLVLHPFADGKPVPNEYVGVTYLTSGKHQNVDVKVDRAPKSGEWYVVMLHRDVNENRKFDFNDGVNVVDAPVFEGKKMISMRFQSKR
jgi:hypothetical protein